MDRAEELFWSLRDEDRMELSVFTDNIRELIRQAVGRSERFISLRGTDGRLLLFGGLVANPGRCGREVWLLGTNALEQDKNKRRLLCQEAPKVLRAWLTEHGELYNVVPVWSRSVRWLKFLGAQFGAPFTFNGQELLPFVIRRRD